MTNKRSELFSRYGIAVLSVVIAVCLTFAVRTVFTLNPTPAVIIAVIVAAWYGGRYPGLLATVLCDLAIDFFFEEQPDYAFTPSPVHIVRLLVLGVIALLASSRRKAEDRLKVRAQQQAAVAALGQEALSSLPLEQLLPKAVDIVRRTLGVDSCAICEFVPGTTNLRFAAAEGWDTNVVGFEFEAKPETSLAGHVVTTAEPIRIADLRAAPKFVLSEILTRNNIRSVLGVVIGDRENPFGTLGAFDRKVRDFSDDDINFLQSIANIVAEAAERLRSEKATREQREWLRTTLSSIGDGVIATDRDGLVTFMNPVAERLTGQTEEAAIGKPLGDVFTLADSERHNASGESVQDLVSSGRVVGKSEDNILISKGGTELPVEVGAAPIRENEETKGVVFVFADVSKRKQAERAERFLAQAAGVMNRSLEVERTIRDLADLTVPALADVCIIDLVGSPNALERAAVAASETTPEDVFRTLQKCPAFDADGTGGIPDVLRTGEAKLYQDTTISSNIFCAGEAGPLNDFNISSAVVAPLIAHGRSIGVISFLMGGSGRRFAPEDRQLIKDFADRAALSIDNARLYRSLQKANRVKDEFLATLSHELRTPLNSILGWSSLLRSGEVPPEQAAQAMETIERNARLQSQIVGDVLDVSRIVRGTLRLELARADLAEVIDSAVATIRPSAEAKNIKISFANDASLPPLVLDAARIQQVMWNLLSNAVKFTPNGGSVDIGLERSGDEAIVAVRDSGSGIDKNFLPKVFDRFQQADSSSTRTHGGLGLGLSIVRHLVELHGGHVTVESEGEGRGSTFTFTLPLTAELPPKAEQPAARAIPNGGGDLSGVRILLVEDHDDSREMITAALRRRGAEVRTAASSAEALTALSEAKPDVLVSDIGLPGEDGYTFLHKARAAYGNGFPAIALTAYAGQEDRAKAKDAGFQIHMPKPVEPPELVLAIRDLISTFKR